MLRDFLEQKEFFINLGSQYKESDLTQYWHFIENYVEAFEPIYEATIIIQKKDCSLSEFYYHWQKAICLVSMLDDVNVFKQSLMTSFEKRDKILLESHALRAALYLDPRFNYAGSKNFTPAEKEQIVVGK
ncbi:uncharacterized protein LOC134206061 [Armigeres subalbatus]|uniref:uncharacterized protein LOC134206061 n=1 Tax=Armigeres subalbatus TaxID=124917 RepID=UPI002ED4DEB7